MRMSFHNEVPQHAKLKASLIKETIHCCGGTMKPSKTDKSLVCSVCYARIFYRMCCGCKTRFLTHVFHQKNCSVACQRQAIRYGWN